jgi:hypothetical protein
MNIVYYRHYKRMFPYQKAKMWADRKLLTPHPFLPLFRQYEVPEPRFGAKGVDNTKHLRSRISKFMNKYPEAMKTAGLSPLEAENYVRAQGMPLSKFLLRQEKYMIEGFTEEKAFEMAEKDFAETLQSEKYERRIFEGLATSNRTKTLMSFYEQQAEHESKQKVQQLERTLPQFKRHQVELEKRYAEILQEKDRDKDFEESRETRREEGGKYSPVTHHLSSVRDNDKPEAVKQNFTERVT